MGCVLPSGTLRLRRVGDRPRARRLGKPSGVSQGHPGPNPRNLCTSSSVQKVTLPLRGHLLEYPGGCERSPRRPYGREQRRQSRDWRMPGQVEEGATSQEAWGPWLWRLQKPKRLSPPAGAPANTWMQPSDTDSGLLTPQDRKRIRACCPEPPRWWHFVTDAPGAQGPSARRGRQGLTGPSWPAAHLLSEYLRSSPRAPGANPEHPHVKWSTSSIARGASRSGFCEANDHTQEGGGPRGCCAPHGLLEAWRAWAARRTAPAVACAQAGLWAGVGGREPPRWRSTFP